MSYSFQPQTGLRCQRVSSALVIALCAFSALTAVSVCRADVESATAPHVMTVMTLRSRIAEPSSVLGASGDPRVTNELAGVGYRWWLSHGRADVGVGLGTLGRVTLSPEPHVSSAMSSAVVSLTGAGPVMVVGWRYRVSNASAVYADASRASLPGAEERFQYNAKLGMEWRPAKSQQLGFDPGTLGVQFDSGYRMSVRLRSGGVKVMLRSEF